MVRAILENRKSQTRRPIKKQPEGTPFSTLEWANNLANASGVVWKTSPSEQDIIDKGDRLRGRIFPFRCNDGRRYAIRCPIGIPGDRFWVRETWAMSGMNRVEYKASPADGKDFRAVSKWKSPYFMPRKYSRITLEITNVRVERVQEISEEDAIKEGICIAKFAEFQRENKVGFAKINRKGFENLWNTIYKRNPKYQWEQNPWVWVITFKEIK